jgi:hypothetical protein
MLIDIDIFSLILKMSVTALRRLRKAVALSRRLKFYLGE